MDAETPDNASNAMTTNLFDLLDDHPLAVLLRAADRSNQAGDPIASMLVMMRVEAAYMRACSNDAAAAILERCADSWEQLFRRLADHSVTYREAAELSIWEYGTLRNKVTNGELTNVGTRSDPRVRLGALPLCPERAPDLHAVVSAERLHGLRGQQDITAGKGEMQARAQRVDARLRATR